MSTPTRLEEAERLLKETQSMIENCDITNGCCCCGDDMNRHSQFDNHAARDRGEYMASQLHEAIKEFFKS